VTEPTAGRVIIKQSRPDESGAALATIARFHGQEIRSTDDAEYYGRSA